MQSYREETYGAVTSLRPGILLAAIVEWWMVVEKECDPPACQGFVCWEAQWLKGIVDQKDVSRNV